MDSTTITLNIVEPGSNVPVPNTGLFTHGIGGPEATIIAVSVVFLITLITIIVLHHKNIKTLLQSKKHLTIGLSILAIIISLSTFTTLILNSSYNNTNAIDSETNDNNNLTVNAENIEYTIELGEEPVFVAIPSEITVKEATEAGYILTAYTENTDLVSTTDSSTVIPMITADEGGLVALEDDTYGFSLNEPTSKDDTIYTSLSTNSESATVLKTVDDYTETPANDTTTIYYGFYITPGTSYGTYTGSNINYKAEKNAIPATVVYHGNDLYFNNDPVQTTNTVKYLVGTTDRTEKYSHTPNITDEGVKEKNVEYSTFVNNVITIPGATSIKVNLTYGGGYAYNYQMGYLSFWQGIHPDYRANINYEEGIQKCGDSTVTDGKYFTENGTETVECSIPGDSVTFDFWSQGGGPGGVNWYGYYAVVTGYDADGNIIYLTDNTQVGGEYQNPSQDLPYIFLGWNEDKDATAATYKSKNDIEQDLPLTKGKTTELYAIWQYATKITFDGNGSTSGEMQDKIIPAGTSTYVSSGNYSRDGYSYTGWNTKPDGTGTSYNPYQSFTVASDKSEVITLYAQWIPVTTIVYDGNGGEGDGPTQTIRAGETSSIYGNWGYFDKDGYIFSHWNTKPDGSGETYYGGDQFTALDQSTTITLYAQWIDGAILDTGTTVNAKLKRLAGNSSAGYTTWDTNVIAIARAFALPTDFIPTDDNTISMDGSATPVYAWYDTDTTTIYYYTESDEIIMNSDSSYMFYNFTSLSDATPIADWNTTYVTNMSWMFAYAGYNATTFSLDLFSWDTSRVMYMDDMFLDAGYNANTWSITIPQKTGDINNTTSAFYGQDSSIYASPPDNRFFTLAAQTNPNTTNTTGSLNSVNNAE